MSQRDRPLGQPQLRVIGGDWRGRKLSFPSKEALGPPLIECGKPCSTGWPPWW
jgi:hypothetical protein